MSQPESGKFNTSENGKKKFPADLLRKLKLTFLTLVGMRVGTATSAKAIEEYTKKDNNATSFDETMIAPELLRTDTLPLDKFAIAKATVYESGLEGLSDYATQNLSKDQYGELKEIDKNRKKTIKTEKESSTPYQGNDDVYKLKNYNSTQKNKIETQITEKQLQNLIRRSEPFLGLDWGHSVKIDFNGSRLTYTNFGHETVYPDEVKRNTAKLEDLANQGIFKYVEYQEPYISPNKRNQANQNTDLRQFDFTKNQKPGLYGNDNQATNILNLKPYQTSKESRAIDADIQRQGGRPIGETATEPYLVDRKEIHKTVTDSLKLMGFETHYPFGKFDLEYWDFLQAESVISPELAAQMEKSSNALYAYLHFCKINGKPMEQGSAKDVKGNIARLIALIKSENAETAEIAYGSTIMTFLRCIPESEFQKTDKDRSEAEVRAMLLSELDRLLAENHSFNESMSIYLGSFEQKVRFVDYTGKGKIITAGLEKRKGSDGKYHAIPFDRKIHNGEIVLEFYNENTKKWEPFMSMHCGNVFPIELKLESGLVTTKTYEAHSKEYITVTEQYVRDIYKIYGFTEIQYRDVIKYLPAYDIPERHSVSYSGGSVWVRGMSGEVYTAVSCDFYGNIHTYNPRTREFEPRTRIIEQGIKPNGPGSRQIDQGIKPNTEGNRRIDQGIKPNTEGNRRIDQGIKPNDAATRQIQQGIRTKN